MLPKLVIKFISILVLAILVQGCERPEDDATLSHAIANETSNILWARLQNNCQLTLPTDKKLVQYYIAKYKQQAYHLCKVSNYAIPYLHHIVEQLEALNMPGELALLPMIESAYKPFATSKMGASGIWQIAKHTGHRYGLKQDHWYDGRKDIAASTKAALNYLQFLYKEFNNDWLLALAAYNAGEGRVKKAIRANKKLGKATDFWSLKLPRQTRNFVPKLLALVALIKNPQSHGIELLPIENKPYFAVINTERQIDLNIAANLAEIDIKELKRLNPGYTRFVTHPDGPHHLLLPAANASVFHDNLAKMTEKILVNTIPHKVSNGETLSLIAYKYKTTISMIKHANNLRNDTIILGAELLIPINKPKEKTKKNIPKTKQIESRKQHTKT